MGRLGHPNPREAGPETRENAGFQRGSKEGLRRSEEGARPGLGAGGAQGQTEAPGAQVTSQQAAGGSQRHLVLALHSADNA